MKLKDRLILVLFIVIILLLAWCTTQPNCVEKLDTAIQTYAVCTLAVDETSSVDDIFDTLLECADPMTDVYFDNKDCDCRQKTLIEDYISCIMDIDTSNAKTPTDIVEPVVDCAADLITRY